MEDTTNTPAGRKVQVRRRQPMSEEGLRHWGNLKHKIFRDVFKVIEPVCVMPYNEVKNRTTLITWLYKRYGFGHFYVFSWRKGYFLNKARKRFVKIAEVKITDNIKPYEADVIDVSGISRYKFFSNEEE